MKSLTTTLKWKPKPKVIKKNTKIYLIYQALRNQNNQQLSDNKVQSEEILFLSQNFSPLNFQIYPTYYQYIHELSNSDYKKYVDKELDLNLTTQDLVKICKKIKQQKSLKKHNVSFSRKIKEKEWKAWFKKYLKVDSEYHTDCLKYQENQIKKIFLKHQDKLLPFQIEHVKTLLVALRLYGKALDASDTGTGKTYVALALARELGLRPVVVCPKSVISTWRRVAEQHFGFGSDEYFISNYEQYRAGKVKYLVKRNSSNSKTSVEYEWVFDDVEKYLVIFDESHKTKNTQTLNYLIYCQAGLTHRLKIISLSATACDTLENSYGLAEMLGLVETVGDFENKYVKSVAKEGLEPNEDIIKNFGYESNTKTGLYKFNLEYKSYLEKIQNTNYSLQKLSRDIFPKYGSRLRINMIGDIPENLIQFETYTLPEKHLTTVNQIYKNIAHHVLINKLKTLTRLETQISVLEAELLVKKEDSGSDANSVIGSQEFDSFLNSQNNSDIADKRVDNGVIEREELENVNEVLENNLESESVLSPTQQKLYHLVQKYAHLITGIEQLKSEWGVTVDEDLKDNSNNNESASRGEVLGLMQEARRKVEMIRVKEIMLDQTKEFLNQGKSIVLFVNFLESLEFLVKKCRLIKNVGGVSVIRGSQTEAEREQDRLLFQKNKHRVVVSTIKAGGVGIDLHDLDGGHPRVSLISPTWSAQDLVQATGRIHRAGGKSKCLQYVVFCGDTIEEKVCSHLREKIKNIKTLNNDDLKMSEFF